jgi:hypothetical protein
MADKKADGNGDEFLAWLAENAPPEDIVATVEYGDGKEKDFHFKRSFLAYDRYVKEISRIDENGQGPNPLAIATTFLIDTVAEPERKALSAFLNAFPGHATRLSNSLLAIYSGDLAVKIKNVSKPAGP